MKIFKIGSRKFIVNGMLVVVVKGGLIVNMFSALLGSKKEIAKIDEVTR